MKQVAVVGRSLVAAAVILPKGFYHPDINDSKQLNEIQRNALVPVIRNMP